MHYGVSFCIDPLIFCVFIKELMGQKYNIDV
jgi:hypothetical protein